MSATIAEYPITTASSYPLGIVTGTNGDLWFTETNTSKIGMINPTTQAIIEIATPTANSWPAAITSTPSGYLWFTENNANQIGEINPNTHAITEYAIPTAGSQPFGITYGPDGNIWFTEVTGNQIGEINPTTHAITEYYIPTGASRPRSSPTAPTATSFTENNSNKIGMINPTTHAFTEFAIPTANSHPYGITAGPDGNLWFTESNTNQIGEINPTTDAFSQYAVPTANSEPFGITAGPDGNLWFTENNASQVGDINPSTHAIAEYAAAAGSTPSGITPGPDGNIWFTEYSANQIGTAVIATSTTTRTVSAGQTVSLTAPSIGGPANVEWEVSTNGGQTFTDLYNNGIYTGVFTNTLTIGAATTSMNGYEYEAVYFSTTTDQEISNSPAITLIIASGSTTGTTGTTSLGMTQTLPMGTVGTIYDQTITVTGGTTPYTALTVNNFSAGTTGLTASDFAIAVSPAPLSLMAYPARRLGDLHRGRHRLRRRHAEYGYTITIDAGLAIISPPRPRSTRSTNKRSQSPAVKLPTLHSPSTASILERRA